MSAVVTWEKVSTDWHMGRSSDGIQLRIHKEHGVFDVDRRNGSGRWVHLEAFSHLSDAKAWASGQVTA